MKTTLLALALFFVGAVPAYAQTIEVTFEQDPLFTGGDQLYPGDSVAHWFSIENISTETYTAYVRTLNDDHTNGLAEALEVEISEQGGGTVYTGMLYDLFIRDNKSDSAPLGSFPAGENRTYDMVVTFAPAAGNDYQDGTATFDLCIGFDGGNENCITGTGDPDDNPDDDDDGGGGGGGGGGGTTDDDDEEPESTPPGIVAGESTTGGDDSPFQRFTDFIRDGLVAGESTTTDEEATSTGATETDDTGMTRTRSPIAALVDGESCTFWWLLLLAAMSLGWSFYDDRLRGAAGGSHAFLVRNVIFSGGYALALLVTYLLGFLESLWWLFAAAWAIMMVVDYRAHMNLPLWSSALRNIAFVGMAAFFIITSFLFGFPCVWWPFFFVALASGLLYFFDVD